MVTDFQGARAAVGACVACRQVWLMTPDNPNCQFCGLPGEIVLRVGDSAGVNGGSGADYQPIQTPATPPTTFGGACPRCLVPLEVRVAPDYVEIGFADTANLTIDTPALSLSETPDPADPDAGGGEAAPNPVAAGVESPETEPGAPDRPREEAAL